MFNTIEKNQVIAAIDLQIKSLERAARAQELAARAAVAKTLRDEIISLVGAKQKIQNIKT